jgi:primosomal protein N' (replication factor Y)
VFAREHDTEAFLRQERQIREEPPYPPATSLVNLLISGPDEGQVGRRAAQVADWCSDLIQRYELPVGVLGPAPCPLVRIKDRWRWHVLLRGPSQSLGRIVRYGARRLRREGDTRIVIDRDPVSLL